MSEAFLDTNVLVRHLTQDNEEQSPRATSLLRQVEQGDLRVHVTDTIVFETVFVLQHVYHVPLEDIRDGLLPILDLPGVVLPGKRKFDSVFDLALTYRIPFADAYHAVAADLLHLDTVVSFDTEFDRISGLIRREP